MRVSFLDLDSSATFEQNLAIHILDIEMAKFLTLQEYVGHLA